MPSLSKLLVREPNHKPQSWQDMKAIAQQWASLGGNGRSKDK